MPSDIAQRLAASRRGYIVAPAGCGKTHTIAEAVGVGPSGRQLVLTHTHAGVGALRGHMRKLGVSRDRYNVETIAGWTLRYASSFPSTSGLPGTEPEDEQWEDVYLAAARLLRTPAVAAVVQRTYTGVYVDEYQDCSINQHQVVLALADLLPCRVLGDPLQAIFGFRDIPSVSWEADVMQSFDFVAQLDTPWRWVGANEALGRWLLEAREHLSRDEPVDLNGAPVEFVELAVPENTSEIAAAYRVARHANESAVVIRQGSHESHRLASRLGGVFGSMEEMDCRDLRKFAKRVDASTGAGRALACIKMAKACMTGVAEVTSSLCSTLAAGRTPRIGPRCPSQVLYRAAQEVCANDEWRCVRLLLEACRDIVGTRTFRRELWSEVMRALKAVEAGDASTLREAAWQTRNITRQVGRRDELRIVSRTLLVKGLEYDHAVVADVASMDAKHLYVALTRGRRSLTVVASSRLLTPSASGTDEHVSPDGEDLEQGEDATT